MGPQSGKASRRGFWLAIVLAALSMVAMVMTPLAGALQTALWLAVVWGIRRAQWWAALTGGLVMTAGITILVMHASAAEPGPLLVGAIIWGVFALVCGYLFFRAALDLRSAGQGAARWPWIVLACGYGAFWLCCEAYYMPTSSMEKTLLQNESILVEKVSARLGRMPGRDELVAFHYPIDPKEVFVKRVAGIPGDRLRLENKQLFRNGAPVAEPYAIHQTGNVDSFRDSFPAEPVSQLPLPALDMLRHNVSNGEVIVPPGRYFVLGDNRDNSLDSRYWGFVSANEIVGRPFLVYASNDLEGSSTKGMATAFNTRWGRLLKWL